MDYKFNWWFSNYIVIVISIVYWKFSSRLSSELNYSLYAVFEIILLTIFQLSLHRCYKNNEASPNWLFTLF